ncbi:MAG: diguanylate cyclase [Leptolyngbyaceae cyanobacterium SL_7_1]|nr:diguanylate cyclase [Leptolyngbyaceae cyanobacterium SL_7_1]
MIAAITRHMVQSLALEDILDTTVTELQQLLTCDRVLIFRFTTPPQGEIIAESVSMSQYSSANLSAQLKQRGLWPMTELADYAMVNDLHSSAVLPAQIELLAEWQIRASLMVPILQGESLWGLLMVHHCSAPHLWQQWEVDLLKQLTNQLAIAIQQAQLYEQLQAANQELQRLALLDGLTHVGNRRCFDDHLQQEWNRLARDRLPLSLILCDVDGFKRFNDLYGHLAGDQCLVQIAQSLLRTSRRPADLVARYGGEEFAIVLPNTLQSGAISVASAVQTYIRELRIPHSDSPTGQWVTVSLGLATTIPHHEASPKP